MSLSLDARQRAMLQEMGVQVWLPSPAAAPAERAARAPAPEPEPSPARPVAPSAVPAAPAPPRALAAAPTPPAAAPPQAAAAAPATPGFALLAPQRLYLEAGAHTAPAALGAGWLIVAEGPGGADPLADEPGRLLDNMLRALQLHRHPRVFLCTLQTQASDAPPAAPCAEALAQAVAAVQPALVLVMGRAAARAVLGRSEPLGHLRAQPHAVGGVPSVVTYDAPYLLRAPAAKAAAWADLCHARALAGGAAPPSAPV